MNKTLITIFFALSLVACGAGSFGPDVADEEQDAAVTDSQHHHPDNAVVLSDGNNPTLEAAVPTDASPDAQEGDAPARPAPIHLRTGSCPDGVEVPGCGVLGFPAGSYQMGTQRVSISHAVIDAFEVTVARFRRFVQAGMPRPSGTPAFVEYPGGRLEYMGSPTIPATNVPTDNCNWTSNPIGRENHPVNCVTYATAQAFCVWDSGRLPTEAEWEYVAGRELYGWGNEEPSCERTNWSGSCVGRTRPVGSYSPNTLGFYDINGNLSEIVADFFHPYTNTTCWGGSDRVNPLCTEFNGEYSVRGGSWRTTNPEHLQNSGRVSMNQNLPSESGFRCLHQH